MDNFFENVSSKNEYFASVLQVNICHLSKNEINDLQIKAPSIFYHAITPYSISPITWSV